MRIFTFCFITSVFFILTCQAQDFVLLAEDEMNDDYTGFMDALMVYYAIDEPKDSLWIKIESHYSQSADRGFVIAMDTDLIVSNGQSIPQNNLQSGVPNNSMNYDIAAYIYETIMLPGQIHYNVYNGFGNQVSDIEIDSYFPNDHVAIFGFKLSRLSQTGEMNFIVGTGSFDIIPGGGGPSDMVPNTGFLTLPIQELGIPDLITPINNEIDINYAEINFEWSFLDLAIEYQFEYSLEIDFLTPIETLTISDTTVIINSLEASKEYFWRVRANDGNDFGEWSDIFSFTTKDSSTNYVQINSCKFLVYPNPASKVIHIESIMSNRSESISLKLFSLEGKLCYNKEYSSASNLFIELPKLKSGKYCIELGIGNRILHSQFLMIE